MSWLFEKLKGSPKVVVEDSPVDLNMKNVEPVEPVEHQNGKTENTDRSIASLLRSVFSSATLGADLFSSGLSLPAWLYEPLSITQRQAEMLEYSHLFDLAAECKDPLDRMAYIAAFAVSCYSGSERYHSSFNPVLGETYEYVDHRNGVRILAEQVSHHPPISASHAEKDKSWVFWQNSNPSTRFLGNAVEIDTHGRTHIYFPSTKDHFYYTNPKTRVHNVILGKMWMEQNGVINVSNLRTGDSAIVKFKKCGFFGNSCDYKIEGSITDSEDNLRIQLSGRWDEFVEATWLDETRDSPKDRTDVIWRIFSDNFIMDEYGLTKYAASLNDLDELTEQLIPPTDSRLRLDRMCLQNGEVDRATRLKKVIEERQRADKKKEKKKKVNGHPLGSPKFQTKKEEIFGCIVETTGSKEKRK